LRAKRRYIALSSLLAAAVIIVSYRSSNYARVRLSSGKQFDVIALSVDTRPNSASSGVARVVVLNYYAKAGSPRERVDEADEMVQVAQRAADSLAVSRIEIQQTYPLGPRWTGMVRGFVWQYYRAPDGTWRRR